MKNKQITGLMLILVGLFSLNLSAQKLENIKTDKSKTCTGEKFVMPQSISVNNEIFSDYIKIASLPTKERRELFSKQTNEQKIDFLKVNLALQMVKRPNLTTDQKTYILEAISKVSAEIYDKSSLEKMEQSRQIGIEMESRVLGLFEYKELGDFIEPLMVNKDEEVRLLQKYQDLLKNGMFSRRKIAKEMPINDRVNIWKVQLAYHLITARLNKSQKDLIVDFMSEIQSVFENSKIQSKDEREKTAKSLEGRILDVFPKAEAFAIFMEIGIQKFVKEPEINLVPWSCNCRWYCSTPGETCKDITCKLTDNCGPYNEWECYNYCQGSEQN